MTPLIDVDSLQSLIADGAALRILDCRARLGEPDAGAQAWREGRIPGALHADLETDLSMSGAKDCGRHPLPDDVHLARAFAKWELGPDPLLVVYDDANGAYAARAWWLATRAGHARCQVLDGGLAAWLLAGGAMESGTSAPSPRRGYASEVQLNRSELVDHAMLATGLQEHELCLIDARAAERYRGDVEPIDSDAGHVPGAHNRPFTANIANGRFKAANALRSDFEKLMDGCEAANVVHMCGSGVTACHNILAMDIAGLRGSRLYAPSWSGWIADPVRPIAIGGDRWPTPEL